MTRPAFQAMLLGNQDLGGEQGASWGEACVYMIS